MLSVLNETESSPVTAQLPGEDGYSGGKIIFIDTENTLYPQVVIHIVCIVFSPQLCSFFANRTNLSHRFISASMLRVVP